MSKTYTHSPAVLVAGLSVGLGMAISGFFVAQGIRDFRAMERHVEVKGLAERTVEADQATWVLSYSLAGDDFGALQGQNEGQAAQIRAFLEQHGLGAEGVEAGQTLVTDHQANPWGNYNTAAPRYQLRASIVVESADVHAVEAAARDVNDLVRRGILLDATFPTYRFTGLNDIKPAMLAEATTNARAAATEFAESAEQTVGDIREARQGTFSISAATQTPGTYADPATSLEKRVRVVTTLDFQLD